MFNAVLPDNRITAAHLHFGAANVNGLVLVTLFETLTPVNVDGLLAKGTIQNTNITHFDGGTDPNNQINSVASLYAAIQKNNIYVNIHSELLLGGAARGQIFTSFVCSTK